MLKFPFPAKAKESSRFVSVGCCSDEFLWHQENKNTSSKSQRDVSLLKKKFSFEERAERAGGGGGVLNRYFGREVRPGCSNPDPV